MAKNEAVARAKKKYQQTHYKTITLQLHNEREADIIEKLAEQGNVQEYLRKLIRKDIKGE